MDTKTLYPTVKEIRTYKQLMKKYQLTESGLMRYQSTRIFNNDVIKKAHTKPC